MARALTSSEIARRIKEGRGSGKRQHYKPWLTVRDVPSRGIVSRVPGRKTSRIHHLLSRLKYYGFLIFEWADAVVDLREQFPLLPLPESQRIAAELGVRHPTSFGSAAVMTTDLLLTLCSATGVYEKAICFRAADSLNRRHTLDVLEIERLYWAERGVTCSIITEHEIPLALVQNLQWIWPYWSLTDRDLAEAMPVVLPMLHDRITDRPGVPLANLCADMDQVVRLRPGASLSLVRHALARKYWRAPFDVLIDPRRPLRGLSWRQTEQPFLLSRERNNASLDQCDPARPFAG